MKMKKINMAFVDREGNERVKTILVNRYFDPMKVAEKLRAWDEEIKSVEEKAWNED